jgi:hypothetical protein
LKTTIGFEIQYKILVSLQKRMNNFGTCLLGLEEVNKAFITEADRQLNTHFDPQQHTYDQQRLTDVPL